MYYNGQVVWDISNQTPVLVGEEDDGAFAWNNIPKNTTHFLQRNKKFELMPSVPKFANGLPQNLQINGHTYRYTDWHREQEFEVALPASVEEAEKLMQQGKIFPAPTRD